MISIQNQKINLLYVLEIDDLKWQGFSQLSSSSTNIMTLSEHDTISKNILIATIKNLFPIKLM